jgi:hypothetical protein
MDDGHTMPQLDFIGYREILTHTLPVDNFVVNINYRHTKGFNKIEQTNKR